VRRGKWIYSVTALVLCAAMLGGCQGKQAHVLWRSAAEETTAAPAETAQAPTQVQERSDDGLEYAIFPMTYLNITQTSHEGTHLCNWAIDLAGADTGIDEFYAPFTLRIVRLQEGYNLVWAQSVNRVHLASGALDYVTLLLEHSDDISSLRVGQVIRQGDVFYSEGTAGNADGNHVHCEFAIGPYVDEGSYHAEDDRVAINNGTPANEILFLTESTIRAKDGDGGFTWQTLPDTTEHIIRNGWHCTGEGHTLQEVQTVSEPTCTACGFRRYTCAVCGLTVTELLAARGHAKVELSRTEPDGDRNGIVCYGCRRCSAKWLETLWSKTPECAFDDVAADDPWRSYIADVAARGLMHGVSDTSFSPEGYLTRVQLLAILRRLSGNTSQYTCDYSDVGSDDPNRSLIGWATENGLAAATSEDKFTPNVAVTRENAISMVLRFTALTGGDLSPAETSDSASFAVSAGLFGAEDNLHCALTRREGAKLLSVLMTLTELHQ
jgi:hypothetical protein